MTDDVSAAANEHGRRVREMFASIAGRYDLLNHLLSANIDKRWRRQVARDVGRQLPAAGALVLDVACGTGDLALTLFEITGANVVGSDFCKPMLDLAAQKSAGKGGIRFVEADALSLPFRKDSFDAVTIAFGLRNLANTEQGLTEMLRVLRPGGSFAVLEFSRPIVPGLRSLFNVYFKRVLPWIGGIMSGSPGAYQYLPNSVSRFLRQEELVDLMRRVGFVEVHYENLTGGIAAFHSGKKP